MARIERRGLIAGLGAWAGVGAAIALILLFALSGKLAAWPALAAIALIAAAAFAGKAVARNRPHSGISAVPAQPAADGGALLRAVVQALPDPSLALDRDGRVVALNTSVLGIAPALRVGEPALLVLRTPELIDAVRRVLANRLPERVEFSERLSAGRWLEVFINPIAAPADSHALQRDLILLTFHDLSQARRIEEMRADFVANASHELRTPLAALSGFIETLKGPARDDAVARERFLNIMESQATRMARLIDDLLSLSRIELNAHLRPDKPVDLLSVVRQVIDALQTLARDRGVEVSISPPSEPLIVPGDRDELIRVFENLIENALKYGASGKRVEVTLARAGEDTDKPEAVVAVRDHGPGIAAEHLPRLTERFYRVDVAGSRAQGGTGLGLALVKHVLNRHRGRLSIESRLGDGATFTVRLPLSPVGVTPADRKS